MTFEVEMKFQVDNFESTKAQLTRLGAQLHATVSQSDTYFRHPCRDFKETDEALRIRKASDGLFVTYKGPKLDQETKTRHEIEFSIGKSEAEEKQFAEFLEALSFEKVVAVNKVRREFDLELDSNHFKIALDEVENVGTFVEVETQAEESELDRCRDAVKNLATELGLKKQTRGSYLGMLMKNLGLE